MKKLIFILGLALVLVGCSGQVDTRFQVGFINDNKSKDDPKLDQIASLMEGYSERVAYLQTDGRVLKDYISQLDRLASRKYGLLITSSFLQNQAVEIVADQNPETMFLAMDTIIDPPRSNVVSIELKTEESAFLAGYVAGITSQSSRIGYIGPESSIISDKKEFGFKAGVLAAAKDLGKEIGVKVDYVEDISDQTLGKSLADSQYQAGIDVIYAPAGKASLGVLESAQNYRAFIIGDGVDMASISPDNVLTSTIINYDKIIGPNLDQAINKTLEGGRLKYGLKEEALGLSSHNPEGILSQETYQKAQDMAKKISEATIVVPVSKETFESFDLTSQE